MTYTHEEALEDMCMDCVSYPCNTLKHKDHCYSYNKLNDLILKSKQYKWHDMKNNPTDLPPMNESVLALIGKNYYVISLVDDDGFWEYQDCYGNPIDEDYNPIIAWREIDSFEDTK